MNTYEGAPCVDMDPEEFASPGTPAARRACAACPLVTKAKCHGEAMQDYSWRAGTLRAGVAYDDLGKPLPVGFRPRRRRAA